MKNSCEISIQPGGKNLSAALVGIFLLGLFLGLDSKPDTEHEIFRKAGSGIINLKSATLPDAEFTNSFCISV
jgi:hypothetical protein